MAEPLTINLEPDDEGYARIARRFSEDILAGVQGKRRKANARNMLVQIAKIAGLLRVNDPAVLARFLVALEQNETDAIMPKVRE